MRAHVPTIAVLLTLACSADPGSPVRVPDHLTSDVRAAGLTVAGAPVFRIVNLAAMPNQHGIGINNNGDITTVMLREFQPYAALIRAGTKTVIDIGTLGGTFSLTSAINAKREIVGQSSTTTGELHAFLWNPETGMRDLGTFGGRRSMAHDVNGSTVVVGEAEVESGAEHPFVWTSGAGLLDLGTLGGYSGIAEGISAAGTVVGQSRIADNRTHAFLWTRAGE